MERNFTYPEEDYNLIVIIKLKGEKERRAKINLKLDIYEDRVYGHMGNKHIWWTEKAKDLIDELEDTIARLLEEILNNCEIGELNK